MVSKKEEKTMNKIITDVQRSRGEEEQKRGMKERWRPEGGERGGTEGGRCGLTGNSAEVEVVSDDLLVVVVH